LQMVKFIDTTGFSETFPRMRFKVFVKMDFDGLRR